MDYVFKRPIHTKMGETAMPWSLCDIRAHSYVSCPCHDALSVWSLRLQVPWRFVARTLS